MHSQCTRIKASTVASSLINVISVLLSINIRLNQDAPSAAEMKAMNNIDPSFSNSYSQQMNLDD